MLVLEDKIICNKCDEHMKTIYKEPLMRVYTKCKYTKFLPIQFEFLI
jgi:hypothetical protein